MSPTLERPRDSAAPVPPVATATPTTPRPRIVSRSPDALIEEARRRAQRRRAGIAALTSVSVALVAALAVIADRDAGRRNAGAQSSPVGRPHHRALALLHEPFIGVACPRAPNSIACDRVGLVVQLRSRAVWITATIAGRDVAMSVPANTDCAHAASPNPICGRYFQGFLQPAGLLEGPLRVRPDRGRYYWTGRHPVFASVRIVAHDIDGHATSTTRRVELHPGYG